MNAIRGAWRVIWRSVLVGAGYLLALIATGIVGSALGIQMSGSPGSESILVWVLISGIAMALFLGPLAAQMRVSRRQHLLVWTGVIFFNMGSVAIEGAFFAPALVSIPLPVLFVQQLLASAAAGVLISLLFGARGAGAALADTLRLRPWHSWAWRFVAGSLSYLLFYFVFGALNYNLVTAPYYATHTGGLTVPSPELVLAAEAVRAPLIMLSVVLFVFSFRATRRRLAIVTGLMLFWIGGVIPLLLQVNALPPLLLVASGVEIFFQNFLTGAVAALLFWAPRTGIHP